MDFDDKVKWSKENRIACVAFGDPSKEHLDEMFGGKPAFIFHKDVSIAQALCHAFDIPHTHHEKDIDDTIRAAGNILLMKSGRHIGFGI